MTVLATFTRAGRTPRPPLLLVVPALVVGIGTLLPVFYLLMRALDADASQLGEIVFRQRNLFLLLKLTN